MLRLTFQRHSLHPKPSAASNHELKEMGERSGREDKLLEQQRLREQREEALLYAWVEQAHREGLERERDKAERRARRAEKRAAKAAKKAKRDERKKKKAKRRGTQNNASLFGFELFNLEVFGRRVEWACRQRTRGDVTEKKTAACAVEKPHEETRWLRLYTVPSWFTLASSCQEPTSRGRARGGARRHKYAQFFPLHGACLVVAEGLSTWGQALQQTLGSMVKQRQRLHLKVWRRKGRTAKMWSQRMTRRWRKRVPVTTSCPGFLSDLVMVARFRTGARSRTPRAFILICEAVLLAVPPMFILVRSLFPNVGWHDRVSYSDDYSKRMLGSDQHCCRKPTYYEPCKREKNVFLLQPAARVFFSDLVMVACFWTGAFRLAGFVFCYV